MTVKNTVGKFWEWMNLTAETAEEQDNRLLERKVKRQLQSAHDDAEQQIFQAELEVRDLYKGMKRSKTLDINKVLVLRARIATLEDARNVTAMEYKALFGEDLD